MPVQVQHWQGFGLDCDTCGSGTLCTKDGSLLEGKREEDVFSITYLVVR